MPTKRTLILLLLMFLLLETHAQTIISGYVADSASRPLAHATIDFTADSNYSFKTVTNERGQFQISYYFRQGKPYTIRLSSAGFHPFEKKFIHPDTGFLRSIILYENITPLMNVTVAGKKPLITRKVDRYIVDVENSFLANGNSGLDVLQKSPGIWVSSDGSIRIKGSQAVMVMINDVVQRMSGEELAEYLKTLKSEDISKIEVIENPPSEFEAAGTGGIVHIILKKRRLNGYSGSISAQYRQQGAKPYVRGGASLDYKLKSFYLFGNVSLTNDQSRYTGSNNITYTNKNLGINNFTIRNNDNKRQQYRFGIAYDISETQSVGIQTIGAFSQLEQSFLTSIHYNTGRPITGIANSEWIREPKQNSTTISYFWKTDTAGSSLKIIGDFTKSAKSEINDFTATYSDSIPASRYRNSSPTQTSIYSLQADYVKVLSSKTELKGGAKYTAVSRNNELINEDYITNSWIVNPAASNHFIYNENLLMLYSSLETAVGKTSVKIGLRAEETFSKGKSVTSNQGFSRKYFGLFPSFFLVRQLNDKKSNSLFLNYSRRLQRPAFNELNPYRLQFDNFTSLIGNPDLLPQYTHNTETGFNFMHGYTASVYYSSTNNLIAHLSNPVGDNKIEYQYQNFNHSSEYGFTSNLPVTLLKGWTTNNSFSFYHLSFRIQDFKIKRASIAVKSIHTITIKNVVDADAYIEYRSPYVNANSKMASIFYTEFGFTKKIWQNRLRLRFSIADIFNVVREKELTTYKTIRIDFYQKRPTRTAAFSITYNFNSGKKFSNRKIEESSSEERNRLGN